MNKKIVKAMVGKDVKQLLKSKRTWMPMLIVTLMLCIIVPIAISYSGTYAESALFKSSNDIEQVAEKMAVMLKNTDMQKTLHDLDSTGKKFVFFFLSYLMVSVFLMVTVINSMVTSTSSFVGEKERGTLETLLYSPITIREMFVSKVLASFLPSILLTYSAYLVSVVAVNSITYPVYHMVFMLNGMWLILMFWLVPLLVLFNILLNVLISAKMKTFQEAQQLGGLLVLPFVGLMITQSTGLFLISPWMLFLAGAVFLILNAGLLMLVIKLNKRNALFESQVH